MADRTSTKIVIPHPLAPDCPITGILEQLGGPSAASSASTQTRGRPIALILHGSMGHKDYLFQRRLAQRLPLDSFRFDFRGNHETPGSWCYGGFDRDMEDMHVVVQYLIARGYVITAVMGHSRGSLLGMRWLCTAPEARSVTAFVNASGRYRMNKILESRAYKQWSVSFAAHGYHDVATTVARKPTTFRIHPADVDLFVRWDTSVVWDRFPAGVHVLTLHGLADQTVPPYDALIYARALGAPARAPGTHTLHIIEEADHNFTGRADEVVDAILEWWDLQARGEVTSSGLWRTGVKGKL